VLLRLALRYRPRRRHRGALAPVLLLRRARRFSLPSAPAAVVSSPPRTRCDSIALYLSGAASAGGVQADPDLALGGYRSSTRCGGLSFLISSPIRGVRIDFVSGANGVGTGSLQAVSEDSLGWTPPGGARGDAVTVLDGQQVMIEGADPTQFIIVTRTSGDDLQGAAALKLLPAYNNVLGQSDKALPSAGATYRAIVFKNGPTQTVRNLKVWIGDVTDGVQIGLDDSAAQPDGLFETVGDENTGPTGFAFVAPDSESHPDVLSVSMLRPNEHVAVWIERSLSLAEASARSELGIRWSYTVIT
jgi:hypothetical protein